MAEVLAGAPDEVVTNAILRMVSLTPFGHTGELALITLDNGADHNRPNTFGPYLQQVLIYLELAQLVINQLPPPLAT